MFTYSALYIYYPLSLWEWYHYNGSPESPNAVSTFILLNANWKKTTITNQVSNSRNPLHSERLRTDNSRISKKLNWISIFYMREVSCPLWIILHLFFHSWNEYIKRWKFCHIFLYSADCEKEPTILLCPPYSHSHTWLFQWC